MPAARKHATFAVASVALLVAFALAGSAGGVPGKKDREALSAPTNVRVTAATPTSVSLAWDPSQESAVVAGYYVYVDAVRAEVTGTEYTGDAVPVEVSRTEYTALNLACGQSIGVWIVAYDLSLNRSPSTAATVSTAACPDTRAPAAPSGFRQAATAEDGVVLAWDVSSDDVGVVGYGVYRDQLPVKSTSDPSADLIGLVCGSTYEYQVDAVDAAGNHSERRSAWVQTAQCSTAAALSPGGWNFCACEYEQCTFAGTKEVRYGKNGTFTAPRVFSNGVSCSNDVFGDPLPGVRKQCEYRDLGGTPPPPPSGGWTFCSYEYEQCTFAGTKEVRYGENGTFTAPRVFNGTVPCSNTIFGDPVPGVRKRCEHRDLGGTPPPPSENPPRDQTPPSQPADLAAHGATGASVSLTWSPSTDNVGVAGYDVYKRGARMGSVASTSSIQGGLVCGTSYWFGIEALDAAGNRSARTSVNTTTSACPPPPSGGWTFCSYEYEQCTFAGTKEVRYGENGTFTAPRVFNSTVACANTIFGDPVPGVRKRCEYRALGGTPPPPSENPPPDETPPSQPPNLAVASVTKTSVSLTWGASTDNVGVTGYGVYVNGNNVLTSNQPSATVPSLACGTAFTFAVDAFDSATNRSTKAQLTAATVACAGDSQAPTLPTNVAASSRTATSIALTWSASTDNVGVTGYGLYRGGTLVGTPAATTGIFSGLTCNTNYTLAVDAQDAAGNRSGKATVMVSTTACADTTAPSSPTGLAASNVTGSGLTLTWNASNDNVGVVAYDVYKTGTKMASTTSRSSSQSGLACATSYWFGVEALDAAGNRSARANVNPTTSACPAPPPPPEGSDPSIGAWRICTNCVPTGGDLSRYRYVGMNAWDYTRIPGLKAANPSIKTLVYKCMSSTRSNASGPWIPAGIDHAWASANHPEWFSLDSGGNRQEWSPYPGSWQMDVGDPAYQNQWAQNVIAELRANGWAGVMVDNANVTPYGALPQEYPTNAAFQAATRSFIANVGPKIKAAGFLFIPNIQAHGDTSTYGPAMWSDWIQFTSGAMREFWMKWGDTSSGHFYDSYWTTSRNFMQAAQAGGKVFLGLTYAPKSDTRTMRYGYASFLMQWDGGPSAFMFEPMAEAQDPWSPEWTEDIGMPSGPAVQVGVGWKRTYTGGNVYVNPSQSVSVTIDGKPLAPMTGLVVRSA